MVTENALMILLKAYLTFILKEFKGRIVKVKFLLALIISDRSPTWITLKKKFNIYIDLLRRKVSKTTI